ncbi:hypothetical protein [Blastomonas sp. AAP53]|uniref:hypothetical protein n=1 Tax=Blastomonas sp. AAP53 TaxID=1248760 RepID=UPI0003676E3D|nr:hypothetical protein [Blastomonas sp. AAP53]
MVADKARNTARAPAGNPIMHRLQIGIGGIFAVLVTVALADMLLQRAGTETPVESASVVEPGMTDPVAPPVVQPPAASEPLVDLGVVPDLPTEGTQHSAGGQTPVVGQLQPDPQSGPPAQPQQ